MDVIADLGKWSDFGKIDLVAHVGSLNAFYTALEVYLCLSVCVM